MHANVLHKPFYMIKLIMAKWIDNGKMCMCECKCARQSYAASLQSAAVSVRVPLSTHRVQIGENEAYIEWLLPGLFARLNSDFLLFFPLNPFWLAFSHAIDALVNFSYNYGKK